MTTTAAVMRVSLLWECLCDAEEIQQQAADNLPACFDQADLGACSVEQLQDLLAQRERGHPPTPVLRTCPICGTEFVDDFAAEGRRPRIYDTPQCRKRAWWRAHRAGR